MVKEGKINSEQEKLPNQKVVIIGIAALHAIKILTLYNPVLRDKYQTFQRKLREGIIKADQSRLSALNLK